MALRDILNFLAGIRGPQTVLEQIEYDGFYEMCEVNFPEDELRCTLYGRGPERILYNPQQDKIVSRYRHESPNQRRVLSSV